jgi:RimJ/RimL family protein N-acetyltransferase
VRAKHFRLVEFRPLRETDLAMLAEWRARPHERERFGPPDTIDQLRTEFLADPLSALRAYIASHEGGDIGFLQSYVVKDAGDGWWPGERDPGARGIDQFLANEEDLGRGLGTAMVRAFVAQLFEDPAVTKVQTDPAPSNTRAIRCYEKAGFTPTGVVDTPDGPALLMLCSR